MLGGWRIRLSHTCSTNLLLWIIVGLNAVEMAGSQQGIPLSVWVRSGSATLFSREINSFVDLLQAGHAAIQSAAVLLDLNYPRNASDSCFFLIVCPKHHVQFDLTTDLSCLYSPTQAFYRFNSSLVLLLEGTCNYRRGLSKYFSSMIKKKTSKKKYKIENFG